MENKTLSDKRFDSILMKDGSIPIFRNPRHLYTEEDVKEFIRELKNGINDGLRAGELIRKDIDKLVGEKLI